METKEILQMVNKYFGIDISERTRKRHYVFARWIFFKLAYRNSSNYVTTSAVGEMIGYDHATVLHGLSNIDFEMKYNKGLLRDYSQLHLKLINQTKLRKNIRLSYLKKINNSKTDDIIVIAIKQKKLIEHLRNELNKERYKNLAK